MQQHLINIELVVFVSGINYILCIFFNNLADLIDNCCSFWFCNFTYCFNLNYFLKDIYKMTNSHKKIKRFSDGYTSSPERSTRGSYEEPYYSQYGTRGPVIGPIIDEEQS